MILDPIAVRYDRMVQEVELERMQTVPEHLYGEAALEAERLNAFDKALKALEDRFSRIESWRWAH